MLRLALLIGALVCFASCENGKAPPAFASGEPISDFSLTLSVRDGSGAEEYYSVERDGTFAFGGGMDARFQRTSWTTRLNADEMNSLRDLVLAQGWLDRELVSTKQPSETRYHIDVRAGERSLEKTIKGENEHIEPVRTALRDIANRRLKADLDRQPEPSIQGPGATSTTAPTSQPQ